MYLAHLKGLTCTFPLYISRQEYILYASHIFSLNQTFKSTMPLPSIVSGDTAPTPWSECQHFSPPRDSTVAWLQSCLADSHYAAPPWWKPVAAAKLSGKKKKQKNTVVSATEAPVSVHTGNLGRSLAVRQPVGAVQYVSVCN